MANVTSDHIKPCNIGSSEAHNRRSPEYLARINKDAVYIRQDLTPNNESWVSPSLGNKTLQDVYNQIALMVKEKTGRAMQTKVREKVDKKTGKVKKVNGSSPIRESVVVCNESTSIDDLRRYAALCSQKWGRTPLQIFLHRDEGHYENPQDKSSWQPNFHAHIIWDWMDHGTGKSFKLTARDTSAMQDLLAETLQMERGKSKAETNREHLERNDFIVAKQKEEMAAVKAETEAKERQSAELDEIIETQKKKAQKNKNEAKGAVVATIASVFGAGKFEEYKKEIGRLNNQILERDKIHQEELQEVKKEYENKEHLQHQKFIRLHREYQQFTERSSFEIRRFKDQQKWMNNMLNRFAQMFYKMKQVFQQAIDAIIDFAKSCRNCSHRDIFYNEEAAAIKECMDEYSNDVQTKKEIGAWMVNFASYQGNLKPEEAHRSQMEVDSVAEGKYDRRISQNNSIKY